MTTHFYVDTETCSKINIYDRQLEDPASLNLIPVSSKPPEKGFIWKNDQWQAPNQDLGTLAIEQMRSQKSLLLTDLSKLTLGNNSAAIANLDILYYRNVSPKSNSKGAYINSKGYLIFPSLKSLKNEGKTISFIFYSGNDSNYLVFGYASPETWNLNSNDYNLTELSLRFRNQRGCYYQQGLFESGRSSHSFIGYIDFDRDYYYRLDIPVGGSEASLYRLVDGDPANWNGGKFKQVIAIATAPDFIGENIYPYFGNYNRSTSPITGVMVS